MFLFTFQEGKPILFNMATMNAVRQEFKLSFTLKSFFLYLKFIFGGTIGSSRSAYVSGEMTNEFPFQGLVVMVLKKTV